MAMQQVSWSLKPEAASAVPATSLARSDVGPPEPALEFNRDVSSRAKKTSSLG